ncbi:MAG: insulinase family protein [Proteobacteria bacterium]|nr:insulinase family protein [Pseudomonadota bacterium]
MSAEHGRIGHFQLENGLDVVVIPDRRAPVVTHMVYYRNGAADDPHGKSGIAHFLEHLMFKGTKAHPKGIFSEIVADLGGQENAFTGHDYTAYYQRVAREHLETMMALESDRMTGLVLKKPEVLSERDVILEERKMHVDADPASQIYESLQAALFTHHPYGTPVIGWEHEIAELTREDALAYYRRFYTPENAILLVAGDVTEDEVRALAEKTYGQIPRRSAAPVRNRPKEPPPRAERTVLLRDERVEQPAAYRAYLTPSHGTTQNGDAHALEVLSQLLGGSNASLMQKELVVNRPVAVNVSSWYRNDAVDDGYFGIYAIPGEGVTLEALDGEIDAILRRVTDEGFADADIRRAKTRLVADLIYAQDNQAQLARIYGAALATGGTIADVQDWPEKIEAVTNDDLKRVLDRYLKRKVAVIGHLEKAA